MGADLYIVPQYARFKREMEPVRDKALAERDRALSVFESELSRLGLERKQVILTSDGDDFFDSPEQATVNDEIAVESVKAAARALLKAQRDLLDTSPWNNAELYFRDSYNSTSVLWALGLSWWQDLEPDLEIPDEAESWTAPNVSSSRCREFLAKVESAPLNLPSAETLLARGARVDPEGNNSLDGWHRYYREKRERLIGFLNRAITNGGMYASC